MSDRSYRRTMLLFAALALYIVLQFSWWGVLLVRRERELAQLSAQLEGLGGAITSPHDSLRGLRMVLGEGSVFLVLLLGVLYLTYRAIRRDLGLARAQRNFLLAVTHELRTPIAAIKLQLQTLQREGLEETQRRQLREQALVEADRLGALTDKVLLATRAEEGMLALEVRPCDAMKLLRGVVDRAVTRTGSDHRITLSGPDALTVHTDEQALRSIAENLVENAVKYTPQGTTIHVEVRRGRDGWQLSVADDGPGIATADRERIFDKFYRGGNEETRRTKGTGLGLYIVQRLVQRMGGTIQVKDREPRGAIFAASFPLR